MFNAQRKRVIREAVWKPWRPGRLKEHENVLPSLQSIQHEKLSTREEDIQFLEFWNYEDSDTTQPRTASFAGIIHDDHVADWLDQRGPFCLRNPNRAAVGGIRILVCEQRESDPLTFPLSRDSYLRVERHFHLSPATLPYFKNNGYSHTWRHSTAGGRNELVLVVKPPSNAPTSSAGLSLSHDLTTGITTAFVYGPGLLSSGGGGSPASRPRPPPQAPHLRELLESCGPALWAHPLLLPALLLASSVERTQAFLEDELSARIAAVEAELFDPTAAVARRAAEKRRDLDALMAEVNEVAVEGVRAACVPAWQARFAGFLGEVLGEVEGLLPLSQGMVGEEEAESVVEVREMMEQLAVAAADGEGVMAQLRARTELQMGALRNSLTQTTNLLTAHLAATATRDGASVKTIALLCTLFLPAIFVATNTPSNRQTLITTFTCSTHTNSSTSTTTTSTSSNPLLSKNLRTYWATTIPLTLLLLAFWLLHTRSTTRTFLHHAAAIRSGQDPLRPPAPPAYTASSTATAIAASTVAGVPGVPGVGVLLRWLYI
ncbi:hypothetical protein BKCO1_3700078 [Neofusicoccum parvum]|uniref:Uncharacterized protein n=1 Tax=Neofusicoccum parvum TaxID=310453 RepID=A0ACB5S3K1_9PEZI|nr:hypothetical protein BKCO1_3700078 [Neofusicoccum parvum]